MPIIFIEMAVLSLSPFLSRFSCVLCATPFDERRAMQTTNMQIRSGSFHSFAFFVVVVVFFSFAVVDCSRCRAYAHARRRSYFLSRRVSLQQREGEEGEEEGKKKRNDQLNSLLFLALVFTVPDARRLVISVYRDMANNAKPTLTTATKRNVFERERESERILTVALHDARLPDVSTISSKYTRPCMQR